MIFEEGHLYHIYNQGNNRQRIFFCRENYLFFLKKIECHILPYADILSWCLMPNHFHLMVHVNKVELSDSAPTPTPTPTQGLTSNTTTKGSTTQGLTSSQTLSSSSKGRTFNHSIGIMLRSYTRAINIQENRSGSLFRQQTQAICLTQNHGIARNWFTNQGITQINIQHPEKQYPNICFNYINYNPIKDRLATKCEEWEFSSYPDILGLRKSGIVNHQLIKEFGLILLSS